MNNLFALLKQLYTLTREIDESVSRINDRLGETEDDMRELNIFETLINNRGKLLEDFKKLFEATLPNWSLEEKEIINQIKELEFSINRKTVDKYNFFLNEIQKLQLGRQIASKYSGDLDDFYTEGIYFDKRN